MRLWFASCALIALLGMAASTAPQNQPNDELAAYITKHCADCHGPKEPEAALDLVGSARANAPAVLGRMWRQLKDGHMPPREEGVDAKPIRSQGLAILEPLLRGVELTRGSAPRRLSRAETQQALRAVFGIDLPEDVLPEDELAHGFDNVANLRTFGPQVTEQLIAAAGHAAQLVLPPGLEGDVPARHFIADEMHCDRERGSEGTTVVLFMNATLTQAFLTHAPGRHTIRVRAAAQQAGRDAAQMEVRVDGKLLAQHAVSVPRGRPANYECESVLAAGEHTLSIAFTNDFYIAPSGNRPGEDRNLHVESASVIGPVLDAGHEPSQRFLARDPGATKSADVRVRAMLTPVLHEIWGRKDAAALSTLVKLATTRIAAGDSMPVALRTSLAAAIASPRFWRRQEPTQLAGADLARRLSFLLWNSVADIPLLEAAERGELETTEGLRQHATRMLADVRARAFSASFVPRWLELANLAAAAPDQTRFAAFTPELQRSMAEEPVVFFEAVRKRELPVSELVNANWSCVDAALAQHYGVSAPEEPFTATALPERGGLLGMAAMLTVTSNPGRTSPVKRGKWILDHLLDAPPPPPPANVGVLDERPEILASLPIRERLQQHRRDPLCASCHQRLDPLGFALEHFDAIGAWRTKDGPHEVDTAGSLPDGRAVNGLAGIRRIVGQERTVARSILRALFTTAIGRGFVAEDEAFLDATLDALPADPKLNELMLAVVTSPIFRRGGR
jgi:hypothetical protein